MPFDNDGYCQPNSFKDLITNCNLTHHFNYWDYVGIGILTIVVLPTIIFIICGLSTFLLYWVPTQFGTMFLTRNKRYMQNYELSWPPEYKELGIGYLIEFIAASCIVFIIVTLFWIGHILV